MPLKIPDLDLKQFDHFFEESQAVLPSLAPQWTNYNLSDPGITLLELFAWLSDINMYRLNRVTEKHFLKYLKILDAQPKAVVPSKVWVSFSHDDSEPQKVKAGTTLSVISRDKSFSLPFRVEKSLMIHKNNRIDYISLKNERGKIAYDNGVFPIFFYPFGEASKIGSYFQLSFNHLFEDDFSLTFILYEDGLPPIYQSHQAAFMVDSSIVLKWEVGGKEVSIVDETETFSKSGTIFFKNIQNCKKVTCTLKNGRFENAPRVKKILFNTTQAVQIETFKASEVTTFVSNGLPHQTFVLSNNPIVSLEHMVIENEVWKETDTLEVHTHQDKVFTLDNNHGLIHFGDGIHGKIPTLNAPIYCDYSTSLGSDGNIAVGSKWSSNDISNKIKIENYVQGEGGENPQTIEDAFRELKQSLKLPSLAVTDQDYEYLATHTPGLRVARAKALLCKNNTNCVNVIVIPFSLQEKPYPTESFLKKVCLHLSKHRLITTEIKTKAPDYAYISIIAEIKLKNSAMREEDAKVSILNKIRSFLHPLTGGKEKQGWLFGYPVYQSDIYTLLENEPNIECVGYLHIQGTGACKPDGEGNIELEEDALTVSADHKITFARSEKVCRSEL